MSNSKVIVGWTAVGCIVAVSKTLQAFQTVPGVSSRSTVPVAGLRSRAGLKVQKDTEQASIYASTVVTAVATGAALASVAAVTKSVYRQRSTNVVARRQAMGGVGGGFQPGQAVKVKIWNGEWQAGVVTSTSPLKIKPNGWADSHVFDDVMATAGEPLIAPVMQAAASAVPITGTFDPSSQLGVTEPLGFFDPLGLSRAVDEEGFRHFRAAELKHGRIAMLASVGCVVQHHIAIPGFEDVPRGLGAFETFPATPIGLFLVALASGYVELFLWKEDKDKLPGDFGNPWCPIEDFEVTDDLRNKEINNGRLAMISIMGIIAAELASGRDGVEQIFGVAS